MFADPTTLTVSTVDYDFHRIRSEGNVSYYAEAGNTASKARTMRILHSQGARSLSEPGKRAQRHVVTFGLTDYDSSVPRTDQFLASLTLVDPNVSTITRAEMDGVTGFIAYLLGQSGLLDKVYRGEL